MNTNTDFLIPEFWAAAFDALDMGKYNLQNNVSRDVETTLASKGDSVTVPLTPDLGTANDWAPGDELTASVINQEKVQVSLNRSKRKTFTLTAKELSLTPYALIETYGVPAAKTIMKAVNFDLYLELMKTQYTVDAMSSFSEDNIIDLRSMLSRNEVGDAGRVLCAGPDNIGRLLKTDAFQFANTSGDGGKAMTEGLVQRKFGFDIFEENIITKHNPADLTGAVNHGGGYNIGDSTMVVDGFDDHADTVRPGDPFTIAGDTTIYTVKSVALTGGDTTSITFTPALVSAAADDAVITVKASQSILGFVPSALGFAARAYGKLPGQVGVQQTVMMLNGLPIRISVWHDGKLGVQVQYDILYGFSLVNEKRAARVITA